jgi:hypothetical protein
VTVLTTNNDDMDFLRSLPDTGDFYFFGEEKTEVYVSTNGTLNFIDSASYVTELLPTTASPTYFIAPFWQDLVVEEGARLIESSTDSYYAITWDNVYAFHDVAFIATVQVVWFGALAKVGGNIFQTGDIVFSYEDVSTDLSNLEYLSVVGLNQGDGVLYAPAYGTANGRITSVSLLPSTYMLFRPKGSGDYYIVEVGGITENGASREGYSGSGGSLAGQSGSGAGF